MIDEIDLEILMIMQSNARITNAEIARQIGRAPSAVLERIRKLEERGVVRGYETRINPKAVGLGLLAFVFVRTSEVAGELSAAQALAELPEVQEVHHVAGEDCFLVKVRVPDTEALGRLLRERVGAIRSIVSTRTTIVLETAKESMALPI
ncbi:MAG: Lrp/AsnC family transcriptional regulator, partial [Gemmatimonadetes bacterium]|nr:Lrp/AsnC family transcriptional regulator [Gemmatimonadota bacterium]